MKPFIGLKKIWYGAPLKVAPASYADVEALVEDMTPVENVHEGTWSYTQDDPSVTDYVNLISGQPYYRDVTNGGNKTIAFTMGQYEFDDLVELQGGEEIGSDGWAAGAPALVYKAVIAQTKTGNFIVFSNAGIIAKANAAEQNLGLGVTAVAMDNENVDTTTKKKVAAEYRFKAADNA
jgi:hypothetical protein